MAVGEITPRTEERGNAHHWPAREVDQVRTRGECRSRAGWVSKAGGREGFQERAVRGGTGKRKDKDGKT